MSQEAEEIIDQEHEPEANLNIKVSRSVHDFIELAKTEGHSKKTVLTTLVSAYKCLNNKETFSTTNSFFLQLKYLEGLHEQAVNNGVSREELENLDQSILVIRNMLKTFEKQTLKKIELEKGEKAFE